MYPTDDSATSPAPRMRRKADSLTGLRWLAVLCVFLSHAMSEPGVFAQNAATRPVGFILQPAGGLGVSFFFVLSGFVLVWSSRPTDTPLVFWRRRLFRVYPNHLVVCGIAILLMVSTGYLVDLHDVPQTLLLVQVWTVPFVSSIGVNGVTWSLACEVVFYLCFPLLFWLARKIRPDRIWWWLGGVVLTIFLLPLVAQLLLPATPVLPIGPPFSDAQSWLVLRFPIARMLEFSVGIMLAQLVRTGRWPQRIPVWSAWLVMAAGWVVAMFTQNSLWSGVAVTIVPIALLIPTIATADLAGRRSFTGRPVMVWLGRISFAFYLLHLLVMEWLVFAFSGSITHWRPLSGWSGVGIITVILAAAILCAWLLQILVELPVYRRFATARRRDGDPTGGAAPDPQLGVAPATAV